MRFSPFAELGPEDRQALARIATTRTFEKGAVIFNQGDRRETIYGIERGLVLVSRVDADGHEQIVNLIGPGDVFPHVGFVTPANYPGSARAVEPCTVTCLARSDFNAIMSVRPQVAGAIIGLLERQILQLQAQLQTLALPNGRQRVVAVLRFLAQEHGVQSGRDVILTLPMTHSELARMVGLSRESVNRVWTQLRREGALAGSRGTWRVFLDKL
jgi:CRP/FNR family cyclic AMP-dependent transcriptional regulator